MNFMHRDSFGDLGPEHAVRPAIPPRRGRRHWLHRLPVPRDRGNSDGCGARSLSSRWGALLSSGCAARAGPCRGTAGTFLKSITAGVWLTVDHYTCWGCGSSFEYCDRTRALQRVVISRLTLTTGEVFESMARQRRLP